MTPLGGRYRFHSPAHWQKGVLENLETLPAGLAGPITLGFAAIPETRTECRAVVAFDRCGRLHWLRPDSAELVALYDFDPAVVGVLPESASASALVLDAEIIWVLTPQGARRYAASTHQLLGGLSLRDGETVVSIASDGGSGLFALLANDKTAILRRYDSFGQPCGKELVLAAVSDSARIASTSDGRWVAMLSPMDDVRFDVVVIDTKALRPATYRHSAEPGDWPPDLIAIDAGGRIHLIAREAVVPKNGAKPSPLTLLTLSFDGDVVARRRLSIPARYRPLSSLAATDTVAIGGDCGLGRLLPAADSDVDGSDTTVSTFITPALVSPDGLGNLWNRADSVVELSPGSSLTVTVAATRSVGDIRAIERLFTDAALGPAERFKAVNQRIPWLAKGKRTYLPQPGARSSETYRFLLDQLSDASDGRPSTHLWLKIEIATPTDRDPGVLRQLVISYPEKSLIDHLPDIYRQKPGSAAILRQFLAPVESVFDGLHDEIGRLSRNIDPRTAPQSWHAYLLSWLGFPPTEGLSVSIRRRLLDNAPALLASRGTMKALSLVLDILTGGRAIAIDSSALPWPWVLPPAGSNDGGPRLGWDTLIIDAPSTALRLGSSATRLKEAVLNEPCIDLLPSLEARNGLISISVAAGPPERPTLEPLLWNFITLFVPSHCHVSLTFGPPPRRGALSGLSDAPSLADDDAASPEDAYRLADDCGARLGATTDLGCWQLPASGSATTTCTTFSPSCTCGGGPKPWSASGASRGSRAAADA